MICGNCGNNNVGDGKFCFYCGSPLNNQPEQQPMQQPVQPVQPAVNPVVEPVQQPVVEPVVNQPVVEQTVSSTIANNTIYDNGYNPNQVVQPGLNNVNPAPVAAPVVEVQENFVKGIIGAVIGAAIGGVSILIFGKMGYASAISGVLMGFCTLKLYEKLGGSISKKGIIASIVIMIAMVFIFYNIYAASSLSDSLKMDVSFTDVFQFLKDDIVIDKSVYVKNLLLIYVFTAIGAASVFKDKFAKNK